MKTKIFSIFLCVTLLFSLLTLSVFADEKSKDDNVEAVPNIERVSRDARQRDSTFSTYVFKLNEEHAWSGIRDLVSLPISFDILFDGGAYVHFESSDQTREPSFNAYFNYLYLFYFLFDDTSNMGVFYSGGMYSVREDRIFLLSDINDYYVYIGKLGVFFYSYENSDSIMLSPYLRFRVFSSNDEVLYFGSVESDYTDELAISDIPEYAYGLGSFEPPTTLSDWFFEKAYPVFGSSMQDTLDLGIFGSYQPVQLYKFLFCLALVIVSIILLVWLPLHLFLRLIGVKRKKKG